MADTPVPDADLDPSEWLEEDSQTIQEAIPAFILEEATPAHPADALPGFELGLTQGRREGFDRGRDATLEALRRALVESGTDAGIAFVLAQRVGRLVKMA